jgi:hypothetical protein
MDDRFSIQLTVGSKTFSILVDRQSEAIYRQAAKMINMKIQQYTNSFPDQKKEDYLTMTLLDIAVKLTAEQEIDDKLKNMIGKIESVEP